MGYRVEDKDCTFEDISERVFDSIRKEYSENPDAAKEFFRQTLNDGEAELILAKRKVLLTGRQYENLISLLDKSLGEDLFFIPEGMRFFSEATERWASNR